MVAYGVAACIKKVDIELSAHPIFKFKYFDVGRLLEMIHKLQIFTK